MNKLEKALQSTIDGKRPPKRNFSRELKLFLDDSDWLPISRETVIKTTLKILDDLNW